MRNFQLQEAKRKKEEELAKQRIEEQRKRQEVKFYNNQYNLKLNLFSHINSSHIVIIVFHRKRKGVVSTWQ